MGTEYHTSDDGPERFWASPDGRTQIIRHTDTVFELTRDGVLVMPVGRFEPICYYVWAEFPPLS